MLACDNKKTQPIHVHAGPGALEFAPDATLGQDREESELLIPESIENLESFENNQIFSKIINPILTEISRLGFPGQIAKESEEEVRTYFTWLGRAMTKALQNQEYSQMEDSYKDKVQEYLSYIVQDCVWNTEGEVKHCLNSSFFRTIPQTIGFMNAYIESQENLQEYYNLLFLTYSLHIAQKTEETDLLYLARAREFLDGNLSENLRNRHLQTLSLILNSSGSSNQILIRFFEEFQITDFLVQSESPSKSELFNLWMSRIIDSELSRNEEFMNRVYSNIEAAQNTRSVDEEALDTILSENLISSAQHLDILGLSEQSDLPSQFTSLIFSKLSLDSMSDGAKQSLLEFLSLSLTKQQIAEQVLSYAKLKLLTISMSSSGQLAQYFLNQRENPEDSPSRKKILKRALDEADQMSPRWSRFISELNSLKRAYRSYFSEELTDLTSGSPIREIMDDLEAIPRNINYYVSFPNMMLMMYHLADEDFSIRMYQFGRGVVTIDIKDIINVFFDGQYAPWFDFGTGTRLGIEYYELDTVFYYALFFGLFDLYQVDPSQYFQLMIDKLLRPGFRSLQEGFNLMQSQYVGNENYEEFLANCRYHARAICQGNSSDLPICDANEFVNQGRAHPLKSNSWDLVDYTFAGLPGYVSEVNGSEHPIPAVGIHPSFVTASSLYWLPGKRWLTSAYNLDEYLERMRVDFRRRIRQIKRLSRITANYLRLYKGEDTYLQFNETIQQQLLATENEIQNYLSHIVKWDSEVSLCTSTFAHLEFETQKELVKLESKYLEQVHSTLKAHRMAAKTSEELKESLFPNYRDYVGIQGYSTLVSGVIEQLQMNPNSNFTYSYPLVILRLREFLLSQNFAIPGYQDREIHLPQSIEDFEFDGDISTEIRDVSYDSQFSSFRRSVFDTYEFLANKDGRAWFKFAPFAWFIKDWTRFKAALIKLGETPININSPVFANTSCAEEGSHFKPCIDKIVEQNLRFNSLMFVDESDAEILGIINKDRFVHRDVFLHRAFFEYELGSNSNILRYYAPLERLYYYTRKPFGGDIGERDQYKDRRAARNMPIPIKRRDIFEDAKTFYLYQAEKPRMIFTPPEWLSLEIEDYFKSTIVTEVTGIQSLGNSIQEIEAEHRESNQFQTYQWILNTPPPLDNYDGGKVEEFNLFLENYHRQTKDFYRPDSEGSL